MTEKPSLTDQQHRAITTRDVSVALSAGAGCGKTFVLTERFLSHLDPKPDSGEEPCRLSQLVAITFTERAAREMRDRIRTACRGRLMDAAESQVDYWLALIRDLDTARISTIHSFCGSLLRAHAVEARLDPQFRVLDQAQADTLLRKLLDSHLRDRLAERDEPMLQLVVQFGLERIYDMVATLLGRRQEIDADEWRDVTPEQLVARWVEYWKTDTVPRVLTGIVESPAAKTVLRIAREHPPSHPTMRQRCELLVEQLPDLPRSSDPAAGLAAILENARVSPGGGGKKAWETESLYGEFRDAASELRTQVKKLAPLMQFDAKAALPAARTALQLLGVTLDVADAYDAGKQELGVLDFNDLLIRARELLVGPHRKQLRERLASQIRLLLVDEFQDTDPLQVELVQALCGDEATSDDGMTTGKLFFVGDLKQSIYRFRGADPNVFRRLSESIPDAGRLPLSLNFRSQPAILDFVNGLFCEALGPRYEPLEAHRPQVSPTPAVELLWATETTDDTQQAAAHDQGKAERLRRCEADWIARRLRAMLDSAEKIVWDEEAAKTGNPATRAMRPGDVTLLFRALSNVEYYEEALRRYEIDYYLVGGHAFYAQQEVFDLLNLLRAVESTCDEVSLAGVLRSPFFGLFDETLFWLARHPEGLAGRVIDGSPLPEPIDGDQRRRAETAMKTLGQLRAIKDRVPVARLIQEALRRTGYDAILLGEFLGERKLANLRKLIDQARSFDRSGIFSLADFIVQLSQFVARQPDEALAATHPESTDVVRLMTIHQSKGLEFPVVVVADVDRVRRGGGSSIAFTRELGPMIKDANAASGYELHAQSERDAEQDEMLRLLYVATTRAADYLILSAGLPALDAAAGPWTKLIQSRFGTTDTPAHGEDEAAHARIRVTTTKPPLDRKPSGRARRADATDLVREARQMADDGAARMPKYLDPIRADQTERRQFSFSRLTGTLHGSLHGDNGKKEQEPQVAPGIRFTMDPQSEPPPLDPLGLGTLVHAVLADIDFQDPGDVAALVRRHAERHLLDDGPPDDNSLDEPIALVRQFLDSPRAARIAAARAMHAELEFLLAWPPGSEEPGGRYLQGFIDCLYQDEEGRWHLLDYKTNRVTDATLDAVADDYRMQMSIYALAVERILGESPEELALHFLRGSLEKRFSWDDAAREDAVAWVEKQLP